MSSRHIRKNSNPPTLRLLCQCGLLWAVTGAASVAAELHVDPESGRDQNDG